MFQYQYFDYPDIQTDYQMAEHFEYANRMSRNSVDQQAINHYRIQINKLNTALEKQKQKYESRIGQLQNLLRERGTRIFPDDRKANQGSNIEVYKKQKQIQQLREQNAKLKRLANKPDDILIKKKDNFDALIQKDQQINRLKKVINQIQSKYDGKYFNEHKIKRDYELLLKENAKLKANLQSRQSTQLIHQIEPQTFEIIKVRKQYQTLKKQNGYLKDKILELQPSKTNNNHRLGINAEIQALRIQLIDANRRNREYYEMIDSLQRENQSLKDQNVNIRLSANPQLAAKDSSQSNYSGMKKSHRKIFERTKVDVSEQDEKQKRSEESSSKAHQSPISSIKQRQSENLNSNPGLNFNGTEKKQSRYSSFGLEESYNSIVTPRVSK